MALGGYMGRILRVDLYEEKLRVEELPETVLRKWVGGRGLGVYLMLREVNPRVNPLSPENKVILLTGPVTGTGYPMSGRWCSVTKSPLTNTIHDSQSGGKWGPELKFAGFDAVIIEGAAEDPVWLWIHNGKAELRCARDLWGRDVHTTTDKIVEELRDEIGDEAKKVKVACIGPAGENLVRFASIMNDKNRAAGRGGHGAVLGAKRLKAVAVRGDMRPKPADEEAFKEALREAMGKIKESAVTSQALPSYGTAALVNVINKHGIYPTRNFRTGVFEGAEKTSGETMAETLLVKDMVRKEACWGCPVSCARYTRVRDGPWKGEGGGPEYETIWAFTAQCGVDSLEAAAKANYLCNELGLDTISMGHTIGTFMELVEKGRVPEEKLRGLRVEWGSQEAVVELTWRTAYRSGVGDDLAEGAKRLAEKYGEPDVAMVVRGQELPAYDPRGVQGHGLAYATSNRGGCHLRAYMISPEIVGIPKLVDRFSTEGKPELVKTFQDLSAVIDSMIVCKFSIFALWAEDYTEALSSVTGVNYTVDDVMKIGERIWNAERAFNILSFGDGREYDTLPRRLLEEPMPEGPAKGYVVKLGEMIDEYYKHRGWIDGRPTRERLEELGLKWLAEMLDEENLLPR